VTLHAGFLRDGAGTRRSSESPRVQVPAGTHDVALVLDVGATLSVLVEEWPGQGMNVGATLVLDEDPTVRQREWVRADGRVRFLGLRSDATYSLWIEPIGDLSLLRAGVHADDGELRVRLEKGKSISVTLLDVPRLGTGTGCYAENPVVGVVRGFPDAYGRESVRGLPAGTYVVHGTSLVGDTWWSGEATATAGGSVEVTLHPKK
jgi:hypothetical protein